MSKRIKVTVRYNKKTKLWEWTEPGAGRHCYTTKKGAVDAARAHCLALVEYGEKVELYIFTKSGKIGKGPSGRSTYPRSSDPKGRG